MMPVVQTLWVEELIINSDVRTKLISKHKITGHEVTKALVRVEWLNAYPHVHAVNGDGWTIRVGLRSKAYVAKIYPILDQPNVFALATCFQLR